ncbi:MAG: hypothetical protein EOP06_17460 [Proteobacteria bacterium]|nr:MAG: hypothetical protein EOP06_17460 [Pseudomonadota bacterium]
MREEEIAEGEMMAGAPSKGLASRARTMGIKTIESLLDVTKIPSLPRGRYGFEDIQNPEAMIEDNYRLIDTTTEEFENFKDTVIHSGIVTPIVIFYDAEKKATFIKAGHKRTKSVLALRGETGRYNVSLPAILIVSSLETLDKDRADAEDAAILSNIQGPSHKGIERARGIGQYIQKRKLTVADACRKTGYDKKMIDRFLSVVALPEEVQTLMLSNTERVKENHAFQVAASYKAMLAKGMDELEAKEKAKGSILGLLEGKKIEVVKSRQKTVNVFKVSIPDLSTQLTSKGFSGRDVDAIVNTIRMMNGASSEG